jgi:cytochrome c553
MKKTLFTLSIILTLNMPLMADGKALYKNCAGCHGDNGKTKGLQLSATIAGQSKAKTVKQLTAYKKGELNKYGLGNIMKMQVATLSKANIQELADYVATLK